jgi:phage shock protein A
MFKKLAIVTVGGLIVVGLLFGRNAWNYATVAWDKIQNSVNDNIPIETQIEAAKAQLKNIEPEIKQMIHKIAVEEVGIDKLQHQIAMTETKKDDAYAQVMSLRGHLSSGDNQYVVKGRSYSNERVREELRNQFEALKTQEDTLKRLTEVMTHRQRGVEAAKQQLEETVVQRNELKVEIENLEARLKMVQVAETASRMSIDDSELSQTRDMIDKIKTRIEVKAKYLSMAPEYQGGIPLNDKSDLDNIESDVDAYLNGDDDDNSVVIK